MLKRILVAEHWARASSNSAAVASRTLAEYIGTMLKCVAPAQMVSLSLCWGRSAPIKFRRRSCRVSGGKGDKIGVYLG